MVVVSVKVALVGVVVVMSLARVVHPDRLFPWILDAWLRCFFFSSSLFFDCLSLLFPSSVYWFILVSSLDFFLVCFLVLSSLCLYILFFLLLLLVCSDPSF